MIFSRSLIPLGSGRVTSGRQTEDKYEFFVSAKSAVYKKTILKNKRTVSSGRIVSFSDECFFFGEGYVEKRGGELSYVAENG